jgi:predicted XRE-type DNA-binding protein
MQDGRIGGPSQVDPVKKAGEQTDTEKTTLQRQAEFKPEDWISQAEAARIRGVTRQAIADLVKKQKFTTFEIGGNVLLNKAEVEAFEPSQGGRPKGS